MVHIPSCRRCKCGTCIRRVPTTTPRTTQQHRHQVHIFRVRKRPWCQRTSTLMLVGSRVEIGRGLLSLGTWMTTTRLVSSSFWNWVWSTRTTGVQRVTDLHPGLRRHTEIGTFTCRTRPATSQWEVLLHPGSEAETSVCWGRAHSRRQSRIFNRSTIWGSTTSTRCAARNLVAEVLLEVVRGQQAIRCILSLVRPPFPRTLQVLGDSRGQPTPRRQWPGTAPAVRNRR
mmetsp:Transcript_18874/g.50600  ORF Transcript_18874/g.50600 Transcript_18874/m.50600 type:complete len:228 (+) Transcript_18874:632-1315(+)